MIEVQNVSKYFQMGKEAYSVLHNISVTIPKGDFTAIVGPSGSGKSTLLQLIGGLDSVSGGTIRVNGMACERTGVRTGRRTDGKP